MRKTYLLIFFIVLISTNAISQGIPSGYYNAATGLVCQPLKNALATIISTGQITLSYGQLDNIQMPIVDTVRTDDGTASRLWDVYVENSSGPEPFTFNSTQLTTGGFCGGTSPTLVGTCWNKEHIFPRSWFQLLDNSYYSPANADEFIVRPTDYTINAKRGNYPYATVSSPTYQFPTAGMYPGYPMPTNPTLVKIGPSNVTGVNIPIAFEPPASMKGDIARSYFYLVTRYQSELGNWHSLNSGDGIEHVIDAASPLYPSLLLPYFSMLYNWHLNDPVDAKEINRNNLVYAQQNNRNPYIDHPEYIYLVWQCTGVLPVTIIDFTAIKKDEEVLLRWTATQENGFDHYQIERSADGTEFYPIGTVTGNNQYAYTHIDNNLIHSAIIYYRLKMIDRDGKFSYSKVAAIKNNRSFVQLNTYPNPVNDRLSLELGDGFEGPCLLRISDLTGRIVKTFQIRSRSEFSNLNVSDLKSGYYTIQASNNTQLKTGSFIKSSH